jgi:hypothetical protein
MEVFKHRPTPVRIGHNVREGTSEGRYGIEIDVGERLREQRPLPLGRIKCARAVVGKRGSAT